MRPRTAAYAFSDRFTPKIVARQFAAFEPVLIPFNLLGQKSRQLQQQQKKQSIRNKFHLPKMVAFLFLKAKCACLRLSSIRNFVPNISRGQIT